LKMAISSLERDNSLLFSQHPITVENLIIMVHS
jgi:hypothetical protein